MNEKTFIIEHLDEELFDWSYHEYSAIAHMIHPDKLIITNAKSFDHSLFDSHDDVAIINDSVESLGIETACLLDSESTEILTPADGEVFKSFLFGGILGNSMGHEEMGH